jgi:sulfate adenylyltransferase subunit 1
VEWLATAEQTVLGPNDIARVTIETQQPIAVDPYDHIPVSGAFVLADMASNHTVAAGMIRSVAAATA